MLFQSTLLAGLAALAVAPEVSATFKLAPLGLGWLCNNNQLPRAHDTDCSQSGAFFMNFFNKRYCVNKQTCQTPPQKTCPLGWFKHSFVDCCVPSHPQDICDCGAGFQVNPTTFKCEAIPGKCGSGQWWHPESSSCCDHSWEYNPPKGNCPWPSVSCPDQWFWHIGKNCCVPKHDRAPKPGCSNWNHQHQCCGTPPTVPTASSKPTKPVWHWKREQATFGEVDHSLYCGDKKACSVPTTSGEWSYECLDTSSEIESCGGCVADGEGQNCAQIPNVKSVTCNNGACEVLSCRTGFSVVNGTSCA